MSEKGHSIQNMKEWVAKITDFDIEYEKDVNHLFGIINSFACSKDFSGCIASTFLDRSEEMRTELLKYSSTLKDCSEFIKQRSTFLENQDSEYMYRAKNL